MIKGEYAEAIGPKGQFKKLWQLRRIAEYEKERLEADYLCFAYIPWHVTLLIKKNLPIIYVLRPKYKCLLKNTFYEWATEQLCIQ